MLLLGLGTICDKIIFFQKVRMFFLKNKKNCFLGDVGIHAIIHTTIQPKLYNIYFIYHKYAIFYAVLYASIG